MAHFFGEIKNGEMILNEYGQVAFDEWVKLPERFPNFELDVFQIMPNHMHGIIALNNAGAGFTPAQIPTMGKLWQRDFYEHIIRNEQSYETISNYIINNPAKWIYDKFYNQ